MIESSLQSLSTTSDASRGTLAAFDLAIFDFWLGLVLLAILACLIVWGIFDTRFALARSSGAAALSILRRNTRRLWILIAGTSVILLGVLISPLPGPGFSVLAPLGLAILATEFAWAGRLTLEIKRRSVPIQDATWKVARRTPRWTVAPVCFLYWSIPIALSLWSDLSTVIIWPASSILFAPVFLWAIFVIKGEPPANALEHDSPPRANEPERQSPAHGRSTASAADQRISSSAEQTIRSSSGEL